MRHSITQVAKREGVGIYKVIFCVPLKFEDIEQVEFHVWKFSEHRIYDMQFSQNEQRYAVFDTVLELEEFPLYHYYFSFYSEGRIKYHEKTHFARTLII